MTALLVVAVGFGALLGWALAREGEGTAAVAALVVAVLAGAGLWSSRRDPAVTLVVGGAVGLLAFLVRRRSALRRPSGR